MLSAPFGPLGVLGDVNKFEKRVRTGAARLVHYDGLVAGGIDAPRVVGTMNLRHVDEHYLEEDARILERYGDRITGIGEGPLFETEGHDYPELELFDADIEGDVTLVGLVDSLTDELIRTWTTRPQKRPRAEALPPRRATRGFRRR